MGSVEPAISGPKRPQDRILLKDAAETFKDHMESEFKRPLGKKVAVEGEDFSVESGRFGPEMAGSTDPISSSSVDE
ncbi:MAG: hypothetical protein AAGF44_09190 [Pseudomonadota bacterium]